MTTTEAKAGIISLLKTITTAVGAAVLVGGLLVAGVAWFLGVQTKDEARVQHSAMTGERRVEIEAARQERKTEITAVKVDLRAAMQEQTELLRGDMRELRQRVDQVYRTVK